MVKKLISLICILSMIMGFTGVVSAETKSTQIKIEETQCSWNIEPQIIGATFATNLQEPSGGTYAHWWLDGVESKGKYISASVNIEKAGLYIVGLRISQNGRFGSTFELEVNGEKAPLQLGSEPQFGEMYHYISPVEMNAGDNIIKINATGGAGDRNNAFVIFFDYITVDFSGDGVHLKKFEPVGATLNVFEKGQNVAFEAEIIGSAPVNAEYDFTLQNFWGDVLIKDKWTIVKGQRKSLLSLGTLDLGWYKLTIKDAEGKLFYEGGMSVVHPLDSRPKYETTPFSFCYSSAYFVVDPVLKRQYAKVAKLAGATWTRDNFTWWYHPDTGDNNYLLRELKPISEEGLEVLVVFDGAGLNFVNADGQTLTGNPVNQRSQKPITMFDAYNWARVNAIDAGDTIDGYEFLNEAEGGFWPGSMDDAAAFVKAACIGIDDADTGALRMYGGVSTSPKDGIISSSAATELWLMNDIAQYSDTINFHEYSFDEYLNGGGNLVVRQKAMQEATNAYLGENDKQVWNTETQLTSTSGAPTTFEAMSRQARGLVTVYAKNLRNGTRNVYNFILQEYNEGSAGSFGAFASDKPYPHYSTYSNMTYQLGEAIYKGALKNLPENTDGELFNNGKQDVAVLWSRNVDTVKFDNVKNAVMIDMFGIETKLPDNPTVTVSEYPIYIRFEGEAAADSYYPTCMPEKLTKTEKIEPRKYLPNERIVLQQKYDALYDGLVHSYGYKIDLENGTKVTLDVSNFNNKEEVVNINAETSKGLQVYPETASVTVPPMSTGSLEFIVKRDYSKTIETDSSYLKFGGSTADGEISRSVSRIQTANEAEKKAPDMLFENYRQKETMTYETGNVHGGVPGKIENVENGVKISDIPWGGGPRWNTPLMDLTEKDKELAEGKKLVQFDLDVPEFKGELHARVYGWTADGRRYWVYPEQTVFTGEKQYVFNLDGMRIDQSPLGLLDPRPFNMDEITGMAVSIESWAGGGTSLTYTVKNFGMREGAGDGSDAFTFEGVPYKNLVAVKVEDTYYPENIKAGEDVEIKITVAEGLDMSTFRMMLNEKEYTDYTVNGNVVTLKLNDIKCGEYSLFVSCEKPEYYETPRATIYFRAE